MTKFKNKLHHRKALLGGLNLNGYLTILCVMFCDVETNIIPNNLFTYHFALRGSTGHFLSQKLKVLISPNKSLIFAFSRL